MHIKSDHCNILTSDGLIKIYKKQEQRMLLWMIATFAAFFIKGLCGFANTLIFTSIMGFGADNVAISPIELMLGYPANFILTWKNRKNSIPKFTFHWQFWC